VALEAEIAGLGDITGRSVTVSKALILGGGGSVGTAWQTGLIAGWNREGIVLTDADQISGTSAGAAVGVQVALGHNLDAQLKRYQVARERFEAGGQTAVMSFDPEQQQRVSDLFDAGHKNGRTDRAVRERICAAAVAAKTEPEEDFLRTFKYLIGQPWPANYVCTTVNVDTAEFEPLSAATGGDLNRGVAAAIAVPGAYPPVTVGKHRYIDGGCLSPTFLDLGVGFDRVLFVQMTEVPDGEEAAVRDSGAELLILKPDADSVESFGGNLMNPAAAFGAADTGLAQGLRTAAQIKDFWLG
jgi:NTE family protein